jgi:AcrR family transcriptional regulator
MPKNEKALKDLKDQRRKELLSAALRLYSTKGLSATKISDIAKSAGYSQGLFYHYFTSKEAAFIELIAFAYRRLHAGCRNLKAMKEPAEEKLRQLISHILTDFAKNTETALNYLLIVQAASLDSVPTEAKKMIRKGNEYPYKLIAAIVREGQKTKKIRAGSPVEMANLFWATVSGLAVYRALLGKDYQLPTPNILERLFIEE